jgi:hypothetical protein
MTMQLDQLRHKLAASENRERLRRLLREAEQVDGAEDLIERITRKLAKLKPVVSGGMTCPTLQQVISEWTLDPHGNLSRVSYSVDYAASSVARVDG